MASLIGEDEVALDREVLGVVRIDDRELATSELCWGNWRLSALSLELPTPGERQNTHWSPGSRCSAEEGVKARRHGSG